jgi:hypothetical protein
MDLVFTCTMIGFLQDVVPVFDVLSLSTAFIIDFIFLCDMIYIHRHDSFPDPVVRSFAVRFLCLASLPRHILVHGLTALHLAFPDSRHSFIRALSFSVVTRLFMSPRISFYVTSNHFPTLSLLFL